MPPKLPSEKTEDSIKNRLDFGVPRTCQHGNRVEVDDYKFLRFHIILASCKLTEVWKITILNGRVNYINQFLFLSLNWCLIVGGL